MSIVCVTQASHLQRKEKGSPGKLYTLELHGAKIFPFLRAARKVLVESNKEVSENREMIKNLERTGNVFGIKG